MFLQRTKKEKLQKGYAKQCQKEGKYYLLLNKTMKKPKPQKEVKAS